MRDDRHHGRRLAATLLWGALLLPATVRAQGVFGTVQLQYQNAEVDVVRLGPDGARFSQRARRETWLRTVDLHHQDYIRPDWLLDSNLRFSGLSVLGTGSSTSTPQGSLRLIHPYLQLTAMHTPSSSRSNLSSQTGLSPDSTTLRSVTARTQETALSAHMAVPRFPQLDLTWTRNRREAVSSAIGASNITRNARMSFDREHYSVYGALGDSRRQSDVPGSLANSQQLANAGGTYRFSPLRNAGMQLQYDFGTSRANLAGVKRAATLSQSATATGDWRVDSHLTHSVNYQWRRSSVGSAFVAPQVDQEGAWITRLAANRGAFVSGGGGIRTTRLQQQPRLQKYATAMASADGALRHNWNVNASASHTTIWDPFRSHYGSETVAGSTRASFGRRAQLDAGWQLAASGDSGSAAQRYSNTWSSRLQASPLRNLTVAFSLRSLRVGPGLLRPSGTSRGTGLDVQWKPLRTFEIVGSYATTGVFPNDRQRSMTRSVSAKLEPSTRIQFYGTYTRSDQASVLATNSQPARHESASGRMQWQPTRRVAASSTLTVSEPGREQEARQVDVAFTWSFGR